MINNRGSFRLRKQFDVNWSIPEEGIEGEGIIFNVSNTGMLFVTDKLFPPKNDLVLHFVIAQEAKLKLKGKIVRFKKVGKNESQYQCGVRFLYESSSNPTWLKWVEDNISALGSTEDSRILDRFLNEGQS